MSKKKEEEEEEAKDQGDRSRDAKGKHDCGWPCDCPSWTGTGLCLPPHATFGLDAGFKPRLHLQENRDWVRLVDGGRAVASSWILSVLSHLVASGRIASTCTVLHRIADPISVTHPRRLNVTFASTTALQLDFLPTLLTMTGTRPRV